MVRVAVTVGAGAVVLGMSAAVANASSMSASAAAEKLARVSHVVTVVADPPLVTEAWEWQ